jgi:hypothetical protein
MPQRRGKHAEVSLPQGRWLHRLVRWCVWQCLSGQEDGDRRPSSQTAVAIRLIAKTV